MTLPNETREHMGGVLYEFLGTCIPLFVFPGQKNKKKTFQYFCKYFFIQMRAHTHTNTQRDTHAHTNIYV